MKHHLLLELIIFITTINLCAASPAPWKGPERYLFPRDLNAFFVVPGQTSVIELLARNIPNGTRLTYELANYAGEKIGQDAVSVSNGHVRLERAFPKGLSELSFPALKQRLGVYAFEEFSRIEDEFWGVNSVFSSMAYGQPHQPRYRNGIFAKPDTIRKHMRLLRRLGIGQLREMDTLWKQAPAPGILRYNIDLAQDTQQAARDNGLHILMYYAHFPDWCGVEGIFSKKKPQVLPLNLKAITPMLSQMLVLDAPAASGAQAGNEWDMGWVAAPPDAVAMFGHYLRYLLEKNSLSTPVVGMAFSGFAESCLVRPDYLKSYIDNGYFDTIDAFGMNGYSYQPEMRRRLDRLTQLMTQLAPHNVPALWITESGKAWTQGGLRPIISEDLISADCTVRSAIDAKAMGVAKYFQFQLHYSPEDYNHGQTFSLLDWSLSPQRTMAAYATAIRLLSAMNYIGKPKMELPGSEDALVFEGNHRRLLVIYRNLEKSDTPICLRGLPVKKAMQMDGAELELDDTGSCHFTGSILYVELQPKHEFAVTDKTVLKAISRRLEAPRKPRPAAHPVVLRTEFENMERIRSGYIMPSRDFQLTIRAFNLDDEPQNVSLNLQIDGEQTGNTPTQTAVINPMSEHVFHWTLSCPTRNITNVTVTDSQKNATTLSLRFLFPPQLDHPKLTIMPKASEWKSWSSGKLTITDDKQEKAMRIDSSFKVADRWFYPRYRLKLPQESLKGCYAMTFEARTDKPSGDAGYKYFGSYLITADGVKAPAGRSYGTLDSQWRTITVFLTENTSDPADIREIEIGACPKIPQATMWVKNIRFY